MAAATEKPVIKRTLLSTTDPAVATLLLPVEEEVEPVAEGPALLEVG